MKFFFVCDDANISPYFQVAYNPPIFDAEFSEDDFRKEYWDVHSSVQTALETLGKRSDMGDGDFAMNETRGDSRWISVECTTAVMWNNSLVQTVGLALARAPREYMVYLSHCMLEYPLFHILITKDVSIGCCDEREFLHQFGFD